MNNKRMTTADIEAARLKLATTLLRHVGPERKVGMGELYETVFGRSWAHRINDTRALRTLITELRSDGMPILSDTHGYWIAASASEVNGFCDRDKRKALAILGRISMMKNVALPDYLGQMQLELEGSWNRTNA